MRKLFLLAVVLIVVPFAVCIGELLNWWTPTRHFDIFAHSSVSMGLAFLMCMFLRKISMVPTYLSVIIPVVFIGMLWELGELFLIYTWYISHFEMIKDLAVDSIGALIGTTVFKEISPR